MELRCLKQEQFLHIYFPHRKNWKNERILTIIEVPLTAYYYYYYYYFGQHYLAAVKTVSAQTPA